MKLSSTDAVKLFSELSGRMAAMSGIRTEVRDANRELANLTTGQSVEGKFADATEELDRKIMLARQMAISLTALILSPLRGSSEYAALRALAGLSGDIQGFLRTHRVDEAMRLHGVVIDLSGPVVKVNLKSLSARYVYTMICYLGATSASLAIDSTCRAILEDAVDDSQFNLETKKLAKGWTAYSFRTGSLLYPRLPATPMADKLRELWRSRAVSQQMKRIIQDGLTLSACNGHSYIVPKSVAEYVEHLATEMFVRVARVLRRNAVQA